MSDLVERVRNSHEKAELLGYPDPIEAAIATVLSDILFQMRSGTFGYYPEHIIKMAIMLRAFAAEHSIKLE